jgi:AraC-like DNA-binding protein
MRDPICKFNDSKASAINCSQFIFETTSAQKKPHQSESHLIGLIAKGNGELTVNGESLPLYEGDIYVIKKGSVFSVKLSPDMEYYYISFGGWHADDLIERMGLSKAGRVFKGSPELTDFWTSCFYRSENGNLDLFSESVLLFTAANVSEKPKEKNELVDKITAYATDNFDDPSLSISDIAKALKYDPKYLSALFKDKVGITFTEYLRDIRCRHAAFLFDEGINSVKSVAILSGFSDALYFSKIFKRETGISPTDYIKRASRDK